MKRVAVITGSLVLFGATMALAASDVKNSTLINKPDVKNTDNMLSAPVADHRARFEIPKNLPSIGLPPPSEETARLKRELAAEQRKSQEAAERAKTAEAEIAKTKAETAREKSARTAAERSRASQARLKREKEQAEQQAREAEEQANRERAEAAKKLREVEERAAAAEQLAAELKRQQESRVVVPPPPPALSGTYTDAATGMEFVGVAGGCFRMGDTIGDGNYDEKSAAHETCVNNFHLGKHEVTQGQWERVMGNNPSKFNGWFGTHSLYPVEQVSWDEVQTFIRKLNAKSGKEYRLPTEAEWEYAARSGGKKEKWSGTSEESELKNYAWYNENSGGSTHEVGTKKPNGLGLYDMTGNVWEWTNDWYGDNYYQTSPRDNPPGASTGSSRVIRGGGWNYAPGFVRAAGRNGRSPGGRHDDLGFRLALPPGQR